MIVGPLLKSESQAPICWVIIVPLAMISGAWFSGEGMPSFIKSFAEALPFAQAINASRAVINGASLSAILPDFYRLIGWTVALFSAGIILFKRRMVS